MWSSLHSWWNARLDSAQDSLKRPAASALFIRSINFIAFVLFLLYWPIAGQMWGPDHIVILHNAYDGLNGLAMLLTDPAWRPYYGWFYGSFLVLTGAAALGKHHVITRFLTYVIFVILHAGNREIGNGGWHLYQHLFLLSVFLVPSSERAINRGQALKHLLHNTAHVFVWVQIALLYAASGWHKLLGEMWPAGESLYITLVQPEYSQPWIMAMLDHNAWYLKLATWLVLLYQVTFPFVIWWPKGRPWLLAFGLVFHISIAFFLVIPDFGLMMVFAYAVFMPEDRAQRWLDRLSVRRRRKRAEGMQSISGTGL